MRQTQIFSGSADPDLVNAICERLGSNPGKGDLGKFSNGETKVQINTSVRDQDVFIVQGGSPHQNDALMELLVEISACKSGSARTITAVMPYFPYSRQSKKKSHRGSIAARMVANLLEVAGVNHVITIDLHASQMQGFFQCPVDNLTAEPLIAHWIKMNVPEWQTAVIVSKNPGGTKRVTSLADALKLKFGIVMTDRRRGSARPSMNTGSFLEDDKLQHGEEDVIEDYSHIPVPTSLSPYAKTRTNHQNQCSDHCLHGANCKERDTSTTVPRVNRVLSGPGKAKSGSHGLIRVQTALATAEADSDEQQRDVITGRLVHGRIVDDNAPSPSTSTQSTTTANDRYHHGSEDDRIPENMLTSTLSIASSVRNAADLALGGSGDAGNSSDEEEEFLMNPELESTVTLVGNVKDKAVLILDDIIDKSTSWIAAAETVVKRGGATKVYCLATHALFGKDCLDEMEACDCINGIVVTNAFPIPVAKSKSASKLAILDVSHLLAEAIRRNHFGESISQLFQHYD